MPSRQAGSRGGPGPAPCFTGADRLTVTAVSAAPPTAASERRRLTPLTGLGTVALALAVALTPVQPPEPVASTATAETTRARSQVGASQLHVSNVREALPHFQLGQGAAALRPDGLGGAGSGNGFGKGGRRAVWGVEPLRFEEVAVGAEIALSSYRVPPPGMHLSASARVVLFPQQGPPART